MKFRLLIIFFVFFGTVVVLPVAAQENTATPSATPTSTPTSTSSPTTTPTSSPSTSQNTTSSTPTATPAAAVAESDKQKVLGEATVLGATGRQIQIAKIVLAAGLGFGVLVGGLRLLYENGQE